MTDPAELLRDWVTSGREVVVPVTGADGATPLGMNDDDGPALVAFSDLDRLVWAMPEGPRASLVPFASVLGLVVQTGRPLRVDATSAEEIRVDHQGAAALIEGRPPSNGITFVGERFDPPRRDITPVEPDPATAGPAHAEPAYAEGWSEGRRRGPLTAEEAAARHQAGEPYVARLDVDGATRVVHWSPDRVVTRSYDEAGRPAVAVGFVRVGDLLFHDLVESITHDPPLRNVVRYMPDGTMRVSTTAGGRTSSGDLFDGDVDGNWVPLVEFGDYRWVLEPR